jgi:hypothetical protein
MDGAVYVFQSSGPYTGSYRTYLQNAPAGNGSPLIPAGSGFFVHTTTPGTAVTLRLTNANRVTTFVAQPTFGRGTADVRPQLALTLRNAAGTLADAAAVYAEAGATPGVDARFDAVKLANPTGLNLASVAVTGEALAVDGRPAFALGTVLPLRVGVPATGTYSLATVADNLPAGLDAFLTDAATGQTVNLRTQPSYSFAVSAAQVAAGSFTLHFGARTALATATALTAAEVALYPNHAHSAFTVLVPAVAGATAVQATLLNALGQVLRRQTAALSPAGARLAVETDGLAAGVYTLRLQVGATALAKRVVIN